MPNMSLCVALAHAIPRCWEWTGGNMIGGRISDRDFDLDLMPHIWSFSLCRGESKQNVLLLAFLCDGSVFSAVCKNRRGKHSLPMDCAPSIPGAPGKENRLCFNWCSNSKRSFTKCALRSSLALSSCLQKCSSSILRWEFRTNSFLTDFRVRVFSSNAIFLLSSITFTFLSDAPRVPTPLVSGKYARRSSGLSQNERVDPH